MRNVLEVLEKNWKINGKKIKGVGNVSGTYSVGIIRGEKVTSLYQIGATSGLTEGPFQVRLKRP